MTQENVCNVLYGFETRNAMRHVGAVKIAAHGDDIRAAEGQKVLYVSDDGIDIFAQTEKFGIQVYSGTAANGDESIELLIGEISRDIT